jgi:tRNA(Ile)-lysidine synthase
MQLNDTFDRIYDQLAGHFALDSNLRLGVAVSGGSDSVALLQLLSRFSAQQGRSLEAVTVNHQLRPEAADEAAYVASMCEGLGVRHETLEWSDWDKQGNLQSDARNARYALISEWARRRKVNVVALGHTQNDQAETFLMRLSREAGVDGLAAMDEAFARDGVNYCRPILHLTRDELQAYLRHKNISWCEDPSNDDMHYLRVRARKAVEVLSSLGIEAQSISHVAGNLKDARNALNEMALSAAQEIAHTRDGDVVFDRAGLLAAPFEIQRRLLAKALNWVNPSDYPPRRKAISELAEAISNRKKFTLNGCLILASDLVCVTREYGAVQDLISTNPTWDQWILEGDWRDGIQLRALGDPAKAGLRDWRDLGVPRESLMSSPSVWYGETMIAAPVAGWQNGWRARLLRRDFID